MHAIAPVITLILIAMGLNETLQSTATRSIVVHNLRKPIDQTHIPSRNAVSWVLWCRQQL